MIHSFTSGLEFNKIISKENGLAFHQVIFQGIKFKVYFSYVLIFVSANTYLD